MKKSIILLFSVFINVHSQWLNDVRLTNNNSNQETPSISVSGSMIHIVWCDWRDGNTEIYYSRSVDGGISWGTEIRLTNYLGASVNPFISVSGSVVHLVWEDFRDGNTEIYYKRSTDSGVTWGPDMRLTSSFGNSHYPSVSVSGLTIHVVWNDNRIENDEIYYKRSTDGGTTWESDIRLTNSPLISNYVSLSVTGLNVDIAWQDNRESNYAVYHKRSIDGGNSWGTDRRLTTPSFEEKFPSIAVSGQIIHVVWNDFRDGNLEIYYKHSSDDGNNWESDTRLTNNPAISNIPNITASGSIVHIVWNDYRDNNAEIYYNRSIDGGNTWGTEIRLTSNSGDSFNPSIIYSGSTLHVAWYDTRDGNREIYYKKNPNGNTLGINTISTQQPEEYALSQNYPNPFNPYTIIRFQIVKTDDVKILVYDSMGRQAAALVNEKLAAGIYEIKWDSSDHSSGIYFCRLTTGNFSDTKKMILLK